MENDTVQSSRDWLRTPRTNLLAWWIPQVAILAGLLVPVPVRAAIWIIALIWMGTACILNARRCGRNHCRYTGPYYLRYSIFAAPHRRRHFRYQSGSPFTPFSCSRISQPEPFDCRSSTRILSAAPMRAKP
jgi:hypothetical protein